eukprot:29960-Eustigmatos_ZCMA.PRE.1
MTRVLLHLLRTTRYGGTDRGCTCALQVPLLVTASVDRIRVAHDPKVEQDMEMTGALRNGCMSSPFRNGYESVLQ